MIHVVLLVTAAALRWGLGASGRSSGLWLIGRWTERERNTLISGLRASSGASFSSTAAAFDSLIVYASIVSGALNVES